MDQVSGKIMFLLVSEQSKVQEGQHGRLNGSNSFFFFGEDIDLVLLTALIPEDRNIILLNPGRRTVPVGQYSSSNLQTFLSSLKDYPQQCLIAAHQHKKQ